mmetsp:Transcript_178/g.341  ORF Transcript_178/g.341 Transcript_178/m.341 type:complete len:884 (+) Transcript_178:103-2754(+)
MSEQSRHPAKVLWIDSSLQPDLTDVSHEYLLSPRYYSGVEDRLSDSYIAKARRNHLTGTDNEYLLSPRRYKRVESNRSNESGGVSRPESIRSSSSRNMSYRNCFVSENEGFESTSLRRHCSGKSFETKSSATTGCSRDQEGNFLDNREGFAREPRGESRHTRGNHRRSESLSGRDSRASRGSSGRTSTQTLSSGRTQNSSGRVSSHSSWRNSPASGRRRSSSSSRGSGRDHRESRKQSGVMEMDITVSELSEAKAKNNGKSSSLPSRDEAIYLQTFYKVMTAFNDKQKTTLALQDCADHGEPMYRRVVFRIIDTLNGSHAHCTPMQRDLVIESLVFLCNQTNVETEESLKVAVDSVLHFCRSSFKELLLTADSSARDKENLKTIVYILGVIALKSNFFLKKLETNNVIRTCIDDILSIDFMSQHFTDNIVNSIVEISLKSQVLYELLGDVKIMLVSISKRLESNTEVSIDDVEVIRRHLARVNDPSVILRNCRDLIFEKIRKNCFSTAHKVQFQKSMLIPHLINRCMMNDLSNCSHILKIFTVFVEQPILREMFLREYSTELVTMYMATMRCEESGVSDVLMKFWLTQRLCSIEYFRHLIFRAEGAILLIMAVMRAVNLEAGESLQLLSPFCNQTMFLDVSLTPGQLIQQFGIFFQCGETDATREQAGDILEVFAEGLEPSQYSSGISNGFIESGMLYVLQNIISDESGETGRCQQATRLLCALVKDKPIRDVFLSEAMGVLHCMITSMDCLTTRSNVVMSLVAVLEVVARDTVSHPRLFESDIVFDLAEHIKDSLVDTSIPYTTKQKYVLSNLNIFDIMLSSPESCTLFKRCHFEDFFHNLLPRDEKMKKVLNKENEEERRKMNSSLKTTVLRLLEKLTPGL